MFKKRLLLLIILILSAIFIGASFGTTADKSTIVLVNPKPNWTYSAPNRILYCQPYKDSYVLLQTTNEVLSLDTKTGNVIWMVPLSDYYVIDDQSAVQTGMQVEKDILITHRGDGAIQSIKADTGIILWEDLSKVGESIDSIYINNETVSIATANDRIIAYDIYTGNIKGSLLAPDRTHLYLFGYEEKLFLGTGHEVYDISAGLLSTPVNLDGLVNEMKSDSGILYISYIDNSSISFSSLSLITFQPLWKTDKSLVPPLASITASIFIDDSMVYHTGEDIVAIEKSSGKLIWRSSYSDEFGKPVIIGNYLFAQGRQNLYVLHKRSGMEVQKISLQGGIRPLEWIMYEKVNPCGNNNTLWIARGKILYAYNILK